MEHFKLYTVWGTEEAKQGKVLEIIFYFENALKAVEPLLIKCLIPASVRKNTFLILLIFMCESVLRYLVIIFNRLFL